MLDYRSTIVAAGLAGALLAGCTDPNEKTDLRTDGPPNVTTVTVMSDLETAADPSPAGIGRIVETATFCRTNDEKRPGLVGLPDIRVIQVCPDDLTKPADNNGSAEAAPPTWFVRVVFDKLLDPSIEDLVDQVDANNKPTGVKLGTLKNTQPVSLKCNGADVAYDGYYVPNGNSQSWPLGPGLFIQPSSSTSVPTGASCTVSVKDNVHNKAGQSVPTDQRDYQFKLAPMELRFTDPDASSLADGSFLMDSNQPLDFFWTAAIKPAAVGSVTGTPSQVQISSGDNLNVSASNPDGDANPAVCDGSAGTPVDPTTIRSAPRGTSATTTALVLRLDVMGGATPLATRWKPNTTYSITFTPDAKVTPTQGGADGTFPSDLKLCFHTSA